VTFGKEFTVSVSSRVKLNMTTTAITVEATLQPDGVTLHLEKKLALPPGRVTVTVQPTTPKAGPTMLEVLDRIHRDQQQRGHRPMTEEEMAADMTRMRAEEDEYEERWRDIWSQTGTKPPGTDTP
jgi:hypothetical protein